MPDFITRAKSAGLHLSEIKTVLELQRTGQPSCGHLIDMLDDRSPRSTRRCRAWPPCGRGSSSCAQGPEIAEMRGFLAVAWNATERPGDMAGMGGMSGMMTDAQMQQLGQAQDAAFDRMFLQMMTEHHQSAVQMAQTELASGQNPEAKALAQKIIADQGPADD